MRAHVHLRLASAGAVVLKSWGALMSRAQDGDRDAYTELLTNVTPYIRALVRRAFRDPADIDEVVQDVLLTIHRIRHTYDPNRPFAPWLTTIARRRVIDRMRLNADHAARKMAVTATVLLDAAEVANYGHEEREALRQALKALPSHQRKVIELLQLRGLSLKDASQKTGISIASLKVTTHRAYKSLRRLLLDQNSSAPGAGS